MKTSIISKVFAAMFFAALSVPAMALQIVVDGIYYEVHDDKLEMTENPDKYSGVVIVPSTVVYEGITYTVTQIDDLAFKNCKDLLTVGIPSTVNNIDLLTFYGCESLEEIYVDPDNTAYASYDRALYDKAMTTIIRCPARVAGEYEIPDGVTTIEIQAFRECEMLTSIVMPETINKIGRGSFQNCSSLTSINLPDGITSIGESSFARCSSLENIHIPGSLTQIGKQAFASCAIKEVHLHDKVTDMGMGIFQNCNKLEHVTLPESMNDLPETTFMGCRNLKEIILPDGITSIGLHAFNGCSSLTSISLPDGITAISNSCFTGCKSLTSIDLPKNIKEISRYGFRNCTSLQSITIPESVKTFGYGAFSGCDTLNDVTNLSRIPQDIDDNTFTHYRTLHVPAGSEQLYAVAEGWKNFNIIGDAPAHDGINDIEAGTKQTQAPAQYYGIDGKRLTTASPKGITIVKTGDGKTKKITSGKRQ